MSDRKYSDPMIYDNSIDSDDDPSGCDGGYDRHGNFINAAAMMELVSLRQQLAELRDAAKRLDDAIDKYIDNPGKPLNLLHKHGLLKAALLESSDEHQLTTNKEST